MEEMTAKLIDNMVVSCPPNSTILYCFHAIDTLHFRSMSLLSSPPAKQLTRHPFLKEAQAATVCMHTALEHVTAVMQTQHLLLDIVEYPKANGRVKWTLFLDGDVVFRGKAENKSEVLCAFFFEKLRHSLEQHTHNRRRPSS